MIHHIVLIRRHDDVSDATIEAAFAGTMDLLREIDGVESVKFAPTIPSAKHNFTHALVAELRDHATLAAYGPHPSHRKMGETTKPLMADILIFDIEL
jgi:hypothetical protein